MIINIVIFLLGWFSSVIFYSPATNFQTNKLQETIVAPQDSSYLQALENLLSTYEGELMSLKEANELLRGKASFAESQKTVFKALPNLRKKIKLMSNDEVKDKLDYLFKDGQLDNVKDYKAFATNLIDLALKEDIIPDNIEDANYLVSVKLSIAKTSEFIDTSEDNFQASKYYKLYANISASPALQNIMLKWKNLTTGEIIKYQAIAFVAENDIQYAWAKPKSGWEAGTYQVSLHNLDDSMSLISRRLFHISSVIDEGHRPVYDGPVLQITND